MLVPHAAGQGGSETGDGPPSPDEVHRQSAVEELAGYLARGGALLARCEALSKAARGDRLGPLYAAARLMNANAQVARALAHVALVESRRRMIVETVQPPAPKNAQLNSRFPSPKEVEEHDNALIELERRLEHLAEAAQRQQTKLEDEAVGCCI